ncbi:antitoxin MazE-like protein [Rhizobium sp. EC-SD404]|uniref:antitoxin MazE-like protein n=1 Tax=Rhizobium sp. EC-SD404 TaxID=2038389 RepID=UPI0012566B19|nr:antitoxin MazE-like protein [Rhizobium sp. EC-SD404]VVT25178.1 conserved hypothetical protein [Rhizobium sp. EC-SD404]
MGRPRERTEEERAELIAEGYRPIEVWVPNFANPKMLALAVAEAKRIALADEEEDIGNWIDAVQQDMWEGQDQI